jgi:hypothetical protein
MSSSKPPVSGPPAIPTDGWDSLLVPDDAEPPESDRLVPEKYIEMNPTERALMELHANAPVVDTSNANFHMREGDDLIVHGRRPKLSKSCALCNLVSNLFAHAGYTLEEATAIERDLYLRAYRADPYQDITRWLVGEVGFEVTEMAVGRHFAEHIPDPTLETWKRINGLVKFYRKPVARLAAEMNMMIIEQFRQDVALGRIVVKPKDFQEALKAYAEIEGQAIDEKALFMEAFQEAAETTFTDNPELALIFKENLRKSVEEKQRQVDEGEIVP